jgi:FKBP-type peptidyl-prolyl cis-trans isomerase SlyD
MTTETIRHGKVVSLTYQLRDERGEVVEHIDVPISYMQGHGSGLFDKIERLLEGHRVGDSLEVTLTPDEGFGAHDPSLTFTDDLENVPTELRYVGARLEAQNASGESMTFVVTGIENGKLTVDANHPLAGQTVQFTITVRDVRDATPEELRSGQLAGTALQ